MLTSDHEFHENRTSENRDGICILYPHLFSDLDEITYGCAIERSWVWWKLEQGWPYVSYGRNWNYIYACGVKPYGKGKGKGKGKGHLINCHDGPEGKYRYCCTLSSNSVLDGGGWSTPHPGRSTPGKEARYPLHRKMDGSKAGLEGCGKPRPPPEFDSQTIQPVVSRCADCAIPAHPWNPVIF
jgi:hypothetical protein